MNRTYSIIYNAALGQYQVASEKTKTRRSKACKLLPIILASLLAPALAVDINDGDIAVNVSDDSNAKWQDYHFKTTNQPDQFGFADWSKALKDYLDNPNDANKKSAWESANITLKDNVVNYFGQNNGYLNINEDKTFTLTASETQPTEKNIKAGELIAISVGVDKNLIYEMNNPLVASDPKDEPDYTSRLFNIEQDGTLVMVGDKGSSITIKGFKVNTKDIYTRGGAIYNLGNVLLGDNVTFEGNTASHGGAIDNGGTFSIGDHAKFEGNTASFYGGAIYNSGIFSLGNHAKFEGNTASSSFGGAIDNSGIFSIGDHAKFEGNTASSSSSYGGAVFNNGIFSLGNNAKFEGNTASSFSSFGGAIYNSGTFNLVTGNQNDVTLFTGNLANGQANSIYQDKKGEFNITGDGTLDMRDPFSGEGTFNKSGNSVWKLGGSNKTANLNINEGTLYLYAKDEVNNANKNDAKAKVGQGNIVLTDKFTLGSVAVLSLGGQGHTIKAGSVDIQDNANIRFNLHNASANSTPIVTFNITNTPQNFLDNAKIDIHTLAKNSGAYTLINGVDSANLNQNSLYIRGESIVGTLLNSVYELNSTTNKLTLNVTKVINNEEVTWNGEFDQWNMTDKNWDGRAEKQYLVGDKVLFTGKGKDIVINAGGVTVSDMVVSGGDYKFSGGRIETMGEVIGTSLTNPTQKLTIQGGAKVDFTGISGKNDFVGGIFLDEGTLSIGTLNQLGTKLSKIKFGTDAILDFKDSITIDGKNGSDQRIVVDIGQKLEIKIADGKTLAFNSTSSTSSTPTSYGGAIYNNGTFSIGDNAKFEGNTASSFVGGAIYNLRTFSIGDNAKFEGNTASSSSSSSGGAIYNIQLFTIGAGAQFIKNEAQSKGGAFGGAISNNGTFNLATGSHKDVTMFRGNLANDEANSIYQNNDGEFNITGNGTLDMRDPFSGVGTFNKSGNSMWKLGGNNTTANLNINAGTLYLYAQNEVGNGNSLDAKAKVAAGNIAVTNMTLGSANQRTKLVMHSDNKLVGDTLTLHSGGVNGSTIFSTALSADNLVTGANIAAMNWDFNNDIKHGSDKEYTFDVSNLTSGVGQYHVLNSKTAHGFDSSQLKFTYAGFDPNSIERLKDVFKLTADATQVYLDYSQILPNGTATWVNTNGSAVWNVVDKNWSVAIPNYSALSKTFLNQDAVVFGDQGLAEQSININAAGSEFELNGMAVNANTNYTFNGDGLKLMAGTEITKQGSGMLAFNNTVTGDVDLQGGSMIIGTSSQNKQAKLSGDVIAQSGTTLGGHGTIEGIATLNQGAVLSPGNSIGTLTVGELNLRNGSKVVLDTAPNGDSDKIIAKKLITAAGTTSGDITIGQNVTLDIVAGAGQWSPSVSYSFMTAEGTITGAFSNVTTNLAFLTPTLVIGANGAPELVMTRNNVGLGNIAKTYNQSATAGAINALTQGHAVYDAVVSMSDDQARLAYDNLSGELYASTESALFQNANRLHESMLSRIHENSTGLWLDGWGYTGEIKGDDNAATIDNKGSGLLLGYDWAMKDNILIGAAVGYEESKIKIKEYNRKGENRVKSTHLMVYGNVDLDVIELKAGLNYSALRFKANRDINIPTLAGNVNAKYRGHQVHAFVEASKKFNIIENYDVAPYLNVAYTMISAKDFTETGSAAALHAKNQNNNRTSLTLGVKNDWYLGTDKNLAITADLGWKHTFGDLTINKRLNFVGSAQSFNIKSAAINKNSAVVGLGIKGQYQDLTIDVGYQGEFNNKVKDHALSAKLKWSF